MPTVYRFRMWDMHSEQFKNSSRWATAEHIKKIGAEIISEGVEAEDDEMDPHPDVLGLTKTNFSPRRTPRGQFPRSPG